MQSDQQRSQPWPESYVSPGDPSMTVFPEVASWRPAIHPDHANAWPEADPLAFHQHIDEMNNISSSLPGSPTSGGCQKAPHIPINRGPAPRSHGTSSNLSPGGACAYSDPLDLARMSSSFETNIVGQETDPSNCTSSSCGTPFAERDILWELDCATDPFVVPLDSAETEWDHFFGSADLSTQECLGSHGDFGHNQAMQGYEGYTQSTTRTTNFDERDFFAQSEPVSVVPDTSGHFQDGEPSTGMPTNHRILPIDNDVLKCEFPGCGKIFDKRHRYK